MTRVRCMELDGRFGRQGGGWGGREEGEEEERPEAEAASDVYMKEGLNILPHM